MPVAFFSKGWIGPQLKWTPQVKEAYACRQAVVVYMPKHFPFARVVLLCDNKNLSSGAESEDNRVARWMFDTKCVGCVIQHWIPGEFNTIADYGSRSVVARPEAKLSKEELGELQLFGLQQVEKEEGHGGTVVPGVLDTSRSRPWCSRSSRRSGTRRPKSGRRGQARASRPSAWTHTSSCSTMARWWSRKTRGASRRY